MGADFIEDATPTFKKSWDRARVSLATADLFTRLPSSAARTAVAELYSPKSVEVREAVIVELNGGELIALKGNTRVARFVKPAPDLVAAVRASCGIAKGTVEQVHEVAGVVEISLC